MVRSVPLSRGKEAICDDDDFALVSQYRYYAHVTGTGKIYAARKIQSGRRNGRMTYTVRYMHHDIAGVFDGLVIDHFDGNSLNNRRKNLRVCTQSENIQNSANGRKPGVFRCVTTGRYAARVSVAGKRIFLGRFDTFDEAAKIVSDFRIAHFQAHKPTESLKKSNKNSKTKAK